MASLEHVLQVERDTLKFRLLALLAVTLSVYLRTERVPTGEAIGLIVGYLAYSLLLDRVLLPRFQSLLLLAFMFLVDVGTVLAVLLIVGFDTPVFILLPSVIVYYSLYLGYAGSLIAATVASLGYAAVANILGRAELRDALSIQVPFFYVVALLTGYLSSQRLREREEKRSLQQVIGAETHARGMLEIASRLIQNLDPATVAQDLARMGALTAGTPLCVFLRAETEGRRLVGLASNTPLEPHGLPSVASISEPLGGTSPGARIVQGQATFVLWNAGKGTSEQQLPPWMPPGTVKELAAVGLPNLDGAVQGVMYFLNVESSGALESKVEELRQFASLAAGVFQRLTLPPQVEAHGTRLVGELQQTVKSMGRFREMRGRGVVRVESLTVDAPRERVTVGQQVVSLNKIEFDVLYLLAEKAGYPVDREVLLREVWGEEFVAHGNVVDVCVHRLRRKLADTTVGLDIIKTVRGRGYMLEPPSSVKP
ncbi:MAG: winged helix-turn-helix transcriptional regulator [Chloroflexi bacterium]|nr:winged helix-turn-helix transcriptional regulator [Chloroflexota bacterium]